jgi:hypothetical protein
MAPPKAFDFTREVIIVTKVDSTMARPIVIDDVQVILSIIFN